MMLKDTPPITSACGIRQSFARTSVENPRSDANGINYFVSLRVASWIMVNLLLALEALQKDDTTRDERLIVGTIVRPPRSISAYRFSQRGKTCDQGNGILSAWSISTCAAWKASAALSAASCPPAVRSLNVRAMRGSLPS